MFGVEVNETTRTDLRQIGKTTNFAIAFGAGGSKIADSVGVSKKQGQEWIDLYFKAYPDLKKYFKLCHKRVKELGYVVTNPVSKLRIYMPEKDYSRWKVLDEFITKFNTAYPGVKLPGKIYSEYLKLSGEFERDSQNYRPQSVGSDISKKAAILIYEEIARLNLWDDFKLVNMVHDELIFDVKDSIKEQAKEIIETNMLKAAAIFCKKIAIPVSITISKQWKK